MDKHATGSGAAFTAEDQPERLAFLRPAAHRALEAYLFALLFEKFPREAVLRHVRLRGWTRTLARKPLAGAAYNQRQKEWRMVDGRAV